MTGSLPPKAKYDASWQVCALRGDLPLRRATARREGRRAQAPAERGRRLGADKGRSAAQGPRTPIRNVKVHEERCFHTDQGY